jgi:regulator of nucleoside diphosphate kinase
LPWINERTELAIPHAARLDARPDARKADAMSTLPRIVLSRFDQERLERLLGKVGPRPDLEALREEIERAEIVEPDAVPPNLVTMNSVVRFVDENSGRESEVTLVFPGHADVESNRISVLAPVGSALLGLSVGDSIHWPLPNARTRRLRVVAVTYQPEAAGDPL